MALVDTQPTSAATIPDPPRYQAAGFWRRAAAAAVDFLVLCPVFALLGAVVALIFGRPLPRLRELGPDLLVSVLVDGNLLGEALLLLSAILLLLYFFIFHALRGQTPGKRLLGLAVIDVYGERPGMARTLLRTSGYVLSAVLFSLGFLWIGFDREKRALHDWLAGTYVVLAR
jgi:uncharacterized RDD family membrane protein YckC